MPIFTVNLFSNKLGCVFHFCLFISTVSMCAQQVKVIWFVLWIWLDN